VFTPTGELRILPAGASVLDFAFSIHTNIGTRCVGGKVGGKPVPIKEKLHTGDVVEILTAKNQRPAPDWVNFVVTSKARQKIKQALSEGEQKLASAGRELLERRLKNWKLEFPDEMLTEMMKKRRMTSVNAFFAAVGEGIIDVNEIKEYIQTEEKRRQEALEAAQAQEAARPHRMETSSKDGILVLNAKDLKGLDYRMAKCCNPVFGDDVFGFVTRESGIKIHRITCPNAARLIENYPYRIQKVRWADTPSSGSFQVSLKVTTDQESEALNKIMEVVGTFKASIRTFNVQENQRQGTYDIVMKLLVPSNLELDKILSQIRAQKHVLKVARQ
jgi:GTP pyrophosphokinase